VTDSIQRAFYNRALFKSAAPRAVYKYAIYTPYPHAWIRGSPRAGGWGDSSQW
jgi:hypothetical protein